MNDTTQTKTKVQPTDAAKLYTKISLVMAAVTSVEKDGHNDFHNYDYASEASILEAIRGALIDQQLLILPQISEGVVSQDGVTSLSLEFEIVDAETGFSITKAWKGTGQDISKDGRIGDKGAYKAMTGAVKYFLLKTFLIPTNDDPENDKGSAKAVSPSATVPHPALKRALVQKAPLQEGEVACETCGYPATIKTGVSAKTGKPWRGTFCTVDREHVKWMKVEEEGKPELAPEPAPAQAEPAKDDVEPSDIPF